MPPRPFPYPLRVGVDICSISRIRAVITRPHNGSGRPALERFLNRILTSPERHYFWERFGPSVGIPAKLDTISQFLAGRFAAKEACRKACDHLDRDTRGLHHIVILPVTLSSRNGKKSSPPQGLILDKLLQDQGIANNPDDSRKLSGEPLSGSWNLDHIDGQLCEISITHDGGFAAAVAVVPSMRKFVAPREIDVGREMQGSELFTFQDDCDTVSAAVESKTNAVLSKRTDHLCDKIEQLRNEEQ